MYLKSKKVVDVVKPTEVEICPDNMSPSCAGCTGLCYGCHGTCAGTCSSFCGRIVW